MRVYAVTRCLEIISEASRRLSDPLKARHPSIAWREIAGAGNIYRHAYQDVAASRVWDTRSIRATAIARRGRAGAWRLN
ncbi:MAG: HepT-like ribonuclease domain-containing protein [Terriglobia bacterium]